MTDISNFSELIAGLSAEIERISRAVDELSKQAVNEGKMEIAVKAVDAEEDSPNGAKPSLPSLDLSRIRNLIRARQLRTTFFLGDIFADPAWDIILCLMEARLAKETITITKLCELTDVPYTTSLRWVGHLTDMGVIEKFDDPMDGRRVMLRLSERGVTNLRRWYTSAFSAE